MSYTAAEILIRTILEHWQNELKMEAIYLSNQQ
jgi:hypothetical protein